VRVIAARGCRLKLGLHLVKALSATAPILGNFKAGGASHPRSLWLPLLRESLVQAEVEAEVGLALVTACSAAAVLAGQDRTLRRSVFRMCWERRAALLLPQGGRGG